MKTVIDQGNGVSSVIAVEDGNLVTGTVQDCTAIAEHTQALNRGGYHGSSEMKHAASLPFVLVERYCNEKGITFQEWMQNGVHAKAMLADPALSHFRVWGGRV